ncbi:TfoX/Sxy family protein [Pelagibacterium sp. H642]|uniref:TfoX/Sxy family protein n=1 Tax=Pelagibacterium sp. H642 TaxID=1881069 RepID=UPI00281517E1|nr:TfoX/Sxy family protein [Pelagibacterium sp. H642]WMT90019.1 TfoX/Sxy family protein [Pelagibacterium sp. H642]
MSEASDTLADRIREHFAPLPGLAEKKMFGGSAFMLDGNMVVAVMKEGALIARVGKDGYEAALARPGCTPMIMGEKTMSGFVAVDGEVIEDDAALVAWLNECLAFASSLPPK